MENASQLEAMLAEQGKSLAALRESYRLEFLARGYMEQQLRPKTTPSDSELRDYYNTHRDDFRNAAAPAPFAKVQDEVRRIVRRLKVERESEALLDRLRRQTVVTTIFDKMVDAEPEP